MQAGPLHPSQRQGNALRLSLGPLTLVLVKKPPPGAFPVQLFSLMILSHCVHSPAFLGTRAGSGQNHRLWAHTPEVRLGKGQESI